LIIAQSNKQTAHSAGDRLIVSQIELLPNRVIDVQCLLAQIMLRFYLPGMVRKGESPAALRSSISSSS
jgi:hypothetical protein